MEKQKAFDFFGNVALVHFRRDFPKGDKIKFAKKLLKENKAIKTVLQKSGNFSGRLRKQKTKHLAGEKTKEVLYKENGCVFRFNVDDTYFSPRLSNERKELAGKIKKKDNVLVMFAGVAPFSIVIAKLAKPKKLVSNELNRKANEYAKLNLELNKLKDKVELVSGDARKLCCGTARCTPNCGVRGHFDVIVMPRPQLKDSFLDVAFKLSKKGTRIFYYDFCKIEDIDKIIEKINNEAKKAKKKIKILKKKSAGDLAPYKIRLRVDLKVLN